MKTVYLLALFTNLTCIATSQNAKMDSAQQKQTSLSADDPSQFFTRVELFNELQHHKNNVYLNQTVLRTNIKIGKRFTTRLDIPFVYNSRTAADVKHSGIGDISFRLLGYKFIENPISAVTASLEISLNTAESPLLGTGKTLLIPLISYSRILRSKKIILAAIVQQTNSVRGDQTRADVSFSKIQAVVLKAWTKKMWTYLAPEWYIDYVKGGLSMNLKSRIVTAPFPRLNLFATAGAGIFGDFIARFQWSGEVGSRYYLFRKPK